MFDLVVTEDTTNRELLVHLMKELKIMALDLSKLHDAVAALSAAVSTEATSINSLIAAHTDPAAQAAVDAAVQAVGLVTSSVQAATSQINAALPAPAPAPAPGA